MPGSLRTWVSPTNKLPAAGAKNVWGLSAMQARRGASRLHRILWMHSPRSTTPAHPKLSGMIVVGVRRAEQPDKPVATFLANEWRRALKWWVNIASTGSRSLCDNQLKGLEIVQAFLAVGSAEGYKPVRAADG